MINISELLSFRIRYSAVPSPAARELSRTAGPLLENCLSQSRLDGIYLYQIDGVNRVLDLVAWRGLSPGSVPLFERHLDARAKFWLLTQGNPSAHEAPAWQDWRLKNLPEFVENRFETAFTMPLTCDGTLAGAVTFARLGSNRFRPAEAAFLERLEPLFGSLLDGAFPRDENARLQAGLEKISARLARHRRMEPARALQPSDLIAAH